jgi:LPS export ABC transporter protein LptC
MRQAPKDRVILPVLLAIIASACVIGCGQQRRVDPASSTGELPDQEVSDFAVTETDQGRPLWKLYARDAATFNSRNTVVARSVRVDFFGEDGKRTSTLQSREGDLNQRSHDMTARGEVVLQTTEGTRLSTEVLTFNNRDQKIRVPEDRLVRVERQGDVLTGYGFESDTDLHHYEFKRQVRATVHTRSGGTVEENRR